MNYFRFHIGDYDSATAHLSLLENGCYMRLLGRYYASESPLPADINKLARLIRARSREEVAALEVVLEEFFQLVDGEYRNARCDEEIARYHEGDEARKALKENQNERARRHRERRAELFEKLREHDIVPKFDTPTAQLVALLSRVTGVDVTVTSPSHDGDITVISRTGHGPVTPTSRLTNNQEPITNNQDPSSSLAGVRGGVGESRLAPPPAAEAEKPTGRRASRLPTDWELPQLWLDWCLEQWPGVSPGKWRETAAVFGDHWRAKSGADATKQDWFATWRNWCRREQDNPRPGLRAVANDVAGMFRIEGEQIVVHRNPRGEFDREHVELANRFGVTSRGKVRSELQQSLLEKLARIEQEEQVA